MSSTTVALYAVPRTKITHANGEVEYVSDLSADINSVEKVVVPRDLLEEAKTIKDMIDDPDIVQPDIIPVSGVETKDLSDIFKLIEKIVEVFGPEPAKEEDKKDEAKKLIIWNFVDSLRNAGPNPMATLFQLILTANVLNSKRALDLLCEQVANMIKGKTPEQIRETFTIKNDQ